MHDLIGAYQRMEEVYRQYIKSAFPLRYEALTGERDLLLHRPEILSQPPLVEPVPVYPSSPRTFAETANGLPGEYRDLQYLAQTMFKPNNHLYEHQEESLVKVIRDRQNIVVTTGTGSGKTECFLLPLLAQLAYESARWPAAKTAPAGYEWWQSGGGKPAAQWGHIERPTAMRAIILYPLNALVEDQLRRLRSALDSNEVHSWLKDHRGNNRITFGRYVGPTAVSGRETTPAGKPHQVNINRLARHLREVAGQRQAILEKLNQDANTDPEIQFYFPRLDGGEMWSRWDMQKTPPDILITNYSMLNIMLMRSLEDSIFEKTRQWLAEPGHPERVFHLIVDELHAYRGTPGTEVAYIIRLLLHRLGLTPDSPNLRILTTTASLEDGKEGQKFLREFFGRSNFHIVSKSQVAPRRGAHLNMLPYQAAFATFANQVQADPLAPMEPPNQNSEKVILAMKKLAQQLGEPEKTTLEPKQSLGQSLEKIGAAEALRDACVAVNRQVRPTQATHLDNKLFPGSSNNQNLVSPAMRGLMLALGLAVSSQTGRSPQPVRGHFFFHNLQNLWACINPNCTDDSCEPALRQQSTFKPTVGALYATHRLSCGCGSRVLDFVVCEVCGEVFLGGYKARIEGNGAIILTADQPDLENMPDQVSLEQRYANYALFWPLPNDAQPWQTKPEDPFWERKDDSHPEGKPVRYEWVNATLNRLTGHLQVIASQTGKSKAKAGPSLKPEEIPGWLFYIKNFEKHPNPKERALPTQCPRCDADFSFHNNPSPLRLHRTGFQKGCQVLASTLLREMPATEEGQVRSQRKLVIFSDSRQDAAKLAAGMERDHYRDMVRVALLKTFKEYWLDFEAYLHQLAKTVPVPAGLSKLQAMNEQLHSRISKLLQEGEPDVYRSNRWKAAKPLLDQEGLKWWIGLPADNSQARQEWEELLLRYPDQVPVRELIPALGSSLLELGICPGGTEYKAKHYWVGDKNRGWHDWYKCYNWSSTPVRDIYPIEEAQTKHITKMSVQLGAEVMYALFPHLARTLEGLGQGWVSYLPGGQQSNPKIRQAADAVIRQLASRRRHIYSKHYREGDRKNWPAFVGQYLENAGQELTDVQDELVKAEAIGPSAKGYVLIPARLALMPAPPPDEQTRLRGYRCAKCRAFYLHLACDYCATPGCNQQLQEDFLRADFDYYVYLAEKSGPAFRMNCEELTGQTDRNTRAKRQRWFQDIFLKSGNTTEIPRVQGVDLLSVTTTMEAGVDIGALLAVMMANMPPRRFNYQQRVGRAGRRTTGVSLAVTYCRGRSHDDFYFQRTESMTGDPPPPPYVDMSSATIFQRVLTKEILRQAFKLLDLFPPEEEAEQNSSDSVHGEFGLANHWSKYNYGTKVQAWLNTPATVKLIQEVLDVLLVQTYWQVSGDSQFREKQLTYLQTELVDKITAIADDPQYTQDNLSERLANAGLLPMFGFPTRVRFLYTKPYYKADEWPPEEGIVDRNLDVAISQFAPGSETVKDKAVYTACGVVALRPEGGFKIASEPGFLPILSQPNTRLIGICRRCQAVDSTLDPAKYSITLDQPPLPVTCTVCQAPDAMFPVDAREPRGFFSNFKPEDFDGQFEWTARSTRPSLGVRVTPGSQTEVANLTLNAFSDSIFSLNDNNGQGGFLFQPARVYDGTGAYAVEEHASDDVPLSGNLHRRVALLSQRRTDILLADIKEWPQGLLASPEQVEGRAAWYSFAFWLRLVAGAYLDVDPLELQAGFRTVQGQSSPDPIGQAFLCDQLENGAGYCSYLGDSARFSELLRHADSTFQGGVAARWLTASDPSTSRPGHSQECDTSCNLCLRDFGNLPYHGLLDWRLALDMGRLASSNQANVDLISDWNGQPNPWRTLLEGDEAPLPGLLRQLHFKEREAVGQLWAYIHTNPDRQLILIERHPLWQDGHPIYQEAVKVAEQRYPGYQIKALNPFIALRRPASYI